jgi:hypothetical protein
LEILGLGFRVLGYGFRVQDSDFRIQSLGFRVQGIGYRDKSLQIRSSYLECRVWGLKSFGALEIRGFGHSGVWRFGGSGIQEFGGSGVWAFRSLEVRGFGHSGVWRFGGLGIQEFGGLKGVKWFEGLRGSSTQGVKLTRSESVCSAVHPWRKSPRMRRTPVWSPPSTWSEASARKPQGNPSRPPLPSRRSSVSAAHPPTCVNPALSPSSPSPFPPPGSPTPGSDVGPALANLFRDRSKRRKRVSEPSDAGRTSWFMV